ncbi:MBL fold metallo-hydrolase [Candidatus Woesebacteria bacterium]|nr:MBL fold metallo-hydrolase [Candidatus Woesebacteria bacterium]
MAFFFMNPAATPGTIPLENGEQLAGFVLPQDNERTQKRWQKTLETEFYEATGEKGVFFPPGKASVLPLLQQFTEKTRGVSRQHPAFLESEWQTERLRLREEVRHYLSRFFQPYGIEVLDTAQLIPHQNRNTENGSEFVVNRFPMADFLFVEAEKDTVSLTPVPLIGWKAAADKGQLPTEVTIYGGVGGIGIVPNTADLSDRKTFMRLASGELRRFNPTLQPHLATHPSILTVDERLLQKWQELGSPIPTETEIAHVVGSQTRKRSRDYGLDIRSSTPPIVELHLYEPNGPGLWNGQTTMVAHRDSKNANALLLDASWPLNIPIWAPGGANHSYKEGIAPFLEKKLLDLIPRLYNSEALINSINTGVLTRVMKLVHSRTDEYKYKSVDEYLLLEIYHRFQKDGLIQILREQARNLTYQLIKSGEIDHLLRYLEEKEATIYGKRKTLYDGIALTHAHGDHTKTSALHRPEIVRLSSPITWAFLRADHTLSYDWVGQSTAVQRLRKMPKVGNSYPVLEYPHVPLNDGQTYEVSPDIFLTAIAVDHIPGSMGFHIEVKHNGRTIHRISYGGDMRDTRFYQKVRELGGTDLLIMEGTHLPKEQYKGKPIPTEELVEVQLDQEIANAGSNAIAINITSRDFKRLHSILTIAQARGRTVIISPKILSQYLKLQMNVKDVFQSHYQDIPVIPIDDPLIRSWQSEKDTYTSEEKHIFQIFKPIQPQDINADPQHYLLIREEEAPQKMDGIGPNLVWINSAGTSPEVERYQKSYAEQRDWRYVSRGVRALGHAPLLEPENDPHSTGVLAQIPTLKPKAILPLHTDDPTKVAQLIRSYPGTRGINIFSDRKAPRLKIDMRRITR